MTKHERIEDVAEIVREGIQGDMTSRLIAARIDEYYRGLTRHAILQRKLPRFIPPKLLAAVGVDG